MGAFGVAIGIVHYMGLYIQLSVASNAVDNHVSGNGLFTEVPQDVSTQSGEDVELACSFRGAGSPSYSLEIQWWYIRNLRDWPEKPVWTTNQVIPLEEMSKDATKISVVKVAGSNISHRLRLSSVKPSDEGTYECRVIDFSSPVAQPHRARAYLQVEEADRGRRSAPEGAPAREPARGRRASPAQPRAPHQTDGWELMRRSTDRTTDCTESCVL